MTVLVLVLSGPLQSWGSSSRYSQRGTEAFPTKSAVIGLLAAAQGRRRTDPVEDLVGLRFGVRADQPGRVMTDYHTAHPRSEKHPMLSRRAYLEDATFVVGLEGPDGLLTGLTTALSSPRFLLFLGRRSCPPSRPILEGLRPGSLDEVLQTHPWQASSHVRRRSQSSSARLAVVSDAPAGSGSADRLRDQPISFDPELRQFTWRAIVRTFVDVPTGREEQPSHDPMALLGGA